MTSDLTEEEAGLIVDALLYRARKMEEEAELDHRWGSYGSASQLTDGAEARRQLLTKLGFES